jgi:hypothetical protein
MRFKDAGETGEGPRTLPCVTLAGRPEDAEMPGQSASQRTEQSRTNDVTTCVPPAKPKFPLANG